MRVRVEGKVRVETKVKVRVRGEVRVRILVRWERGLRPNRCRASLLLAVCLSTKLSVCLDAPAALAHIVWRAEDDGDALVHVLRHLVRVRVRVGVRVRVRVRVGVRVGVRVKVRVRVREAVVAVQGIGGVACRIGGHGVAEAGVPG